LPVTCIRRKECLDMDKQITDNYKVYWDDGSGEYSPTPYSYVRLYAATQRIRRLAEEHPESRFKIVHLRTEYDPKTRRRKKTKAELYYDFKKSEYPLEVK